MGVIIPETGTRVTVKTDTQSLNELINSIQSDEILSQVLAPTAEQLARDKEILKESSTDLAYAIANRLKSYQEQFISMNQSISTGYMHDTIFVEHKGDGEAEIGATALSESGFPYPIVVEKGSRPHMITGNPLLAFNWPKNGVFVITRSVQHPGTGPKPFVKPSLEYIGKDVDELVQSEVVSKLGE